MSRLASSLMDGTCCESEMPTISSASSKPSTSSGRRRADLHSSVLDSHIGYGSPHKQDTAAAHGEPLGDEEVRLTKRSYGWPEDEKFLCSGWSVRAFRGGHGRTRREFAARMDGAVGSLSGQASRAGERNRADAAAGAPSRVGTVTSLFFQPTQRESQVGTLRERF